MAVAGTVNILLHSDYIGNRVDVSYSNTTDGDAAETSFSFLSGQQINEKIILCSQAVGSSETLSLPETAISPKPQTSATKVVPINAAQHSQA